MWNGDVLTGLRRQKKLTAQALADKIGVSRPYISQLEKGQRVPGEALMQKMAVYFGVSTQTFHQREINGTIQDVVPYKAASVNQTVDILLVDESAKRDTDSTSGFTIFMLIGLIGGILSDVRATVITDGSLNSAQVLTGIMLQDLSNLTTRGTYQLVTTREWVSLRLTSIDVPIDVDRFYRSADTKPHVELRDTTDDSRQSELIWFTEYASLYYRYHQCRIWEQQGKTVKICDSELVEYWKLGINNLEH